MTLYRDRRLALALVLALALHGNEAHAQDNMCTGNLGDVRVRGNLNVTARCQLTGTDVRGNVVLFAGGALIARGARIRGNLEAADRADFVELDRVRVDGNLNLRDLVGDSSSIERTDIRGNAVLASNRSSFELLNSDFRGNLRASGNRGGLLISGNSIDGNLACAGNSPAPTGLGNRIDGDAEGQCANLRPEPEPDTPPPTTTPPAQTRPPAASPPAAAPPATPPGRPSTPAPTPPPTARPPANVPPAAAPPAAAPPAATPPAAAPPAATPPAAAPPSPPPAAAPPATTPPATEIAAVDDGGAGALGWPVAFLLPLVMLRRLSRRRWDRRQQAG